MATLLHLILTEVYELQQAGHVDDGEQRGVAVEGEVVRPRLQAVLVHQRHARQRVPGSGGVSSVY